MKIIDWDRKGNVLRLYLGEDNLKKWGGDDWNDRPYEHNAGTVYDEFVSKIVDIGFPYGYGLYEPADDDINSGFCKDDFKKGIPFLVIVPETRDYWNSYAKDVNREGNIPLRFGDSITEVCKYGIILSEVELKPDKKICPRCHTEFWAASSQCPACGYIDESV